MIANSFSYPGGSMKGRYIIVVMALLLVAGVAGAGYHATTISSDGAVMLSSAGSDENGSVVSRVMALDDARISRTIEDEGDLNSGSDLQEDLSVWGTGPVLFTGFASGVLKSSDLRTRCAFLDETGERIGEATNVISGILQHGELDSSRTGGSSISGVTAVNGSGMVYAGSQMTGNKTLRNRDFIAGNMSVKDIFRYGGKI